MAELGSALPVSSLNAPEDKRTADPRRLLTNLLQAAIAAADPASVLRDHLPARPAGRCIVVGAGKAAASMAAALEAAWADVDLSGTVVVPYGYATSCLRVRVLEAGHPVPDASSVAAAQEIMAAVQGLHADDLVIALISGGGSAAMCLPLDGITLKDKQATNRLLLSSGLDIRVMNAVRRRVSAIKGGRLAAAAGQARVVTLAISDIPGDDPAAIASGPTFADSTANIDLEEVAARLGQALPARVAALLVAPAEPVPNRQGDEFRIIATPAQSLNAAAMLARSYGVAPILLGDAIEGESREVAARMAKMVGQVTTPTVFISGGETTVTIDCSAPGRGGRNTEFALALACALNGRHDVWAIAADTDGEDGANFGAAGAICTPDTLHRARVSGIDPQDHLKRHDSGRFFEALGDLVVTGPTCTNVNDFRAILVVPRPV